MLTDQDSPRASPQSPPVAQTEQPTFYGLHILTALLMFGLDQGAGALEIATLFLSLLLSFFLAALAFPVCVLIQRYVAHDSWQASVAKSAVVSCLLAIPTGLPGWLTLAWGITTTLRSKQSSHPSQLN